MVIESPSSTSAISAADGSFGRDMPDHHPVSSPGKSAIGDQSDRICLNHPDQGRGRREHFAHSRTAFRAFVANHDDVAALNLPCNNGRHAGFFGIENPCLPGNSRVFTPVILATQPSAQDCRAGSRDGLARTADFPIAGSHPDPCGRRRNILSDFRPRYPVIVTQSPCKSPCSSSIFITCGMPPALCRSVATYRPEGFRSHNTGTLPRMRSKSSMVQRHFHRMGNGQKMQHGIGRATHRHNHRNGIFKRFARHDVARANLLPDRSTRTSRRPRGTHVLFIVFRRHGGRVRQAHSHCFDRRRHGIRRVHAAARTGARAGAALHFEKFLLVDFVRA